MSIVLNVYRKIKLCFLITTEYVGYQKLADQSCYQQIKGPHSDLNSAFNECNTMGRECKGVQYVNCSGIAKITKSLFEEQCKTKAAINTFTSIVNNPDCTILLYAKSKYFIEIFDTQF